MKYRWKRLGQRNSFGYWFRTVSAAFILAALVTDMFDPWVVPFIERPYGIYRADFIDDIERATDFSQFAGSLRVNDRALPLHTWVGRNR